jgi:protein-disulfide isomerase
MFRFLRRTLLFALLTSFGLALHAGTVSAQLEGQFEPIAALPEPHSLDVVVFQEYLNFTCPHCNNFRDASKPLFSKYGKRLKVEYIPILFRGQNDAPLRLFFIAQRAGREYDVMVMIFDATFKYGVNINDPAVVGYLARTAGLGPAFQEQAGAEWVSRKVAEAQNRAAVAGVEATPTVVLQGALRVVPESGMQEYVANLDRLIDQLLKKKG